MSSNVYSKLQAARVLLSKTDLKKSGNNKHLNFAYFELQDFVPAINQIFEDVGLIGIVDFNDDSKVRLNIVNVESPSEIISFAIDKADAGLRSGTPIQNTGAQQTYLRRYLWIQAMELTENDAVDTLGHDEKITQADANKQRAVSADKQQAIAYKETLTIAATLEQLRSAYKAIPSKFRTGDLESYSKARAIELTPIPDKINACANMDELTKLCDTFTDEQNALYDELIAEKLDTLRG